jgi:hypothetical protein
MNSTVSNSLKDVEQRLADFVRLAKPAVPADLHDQLKKVRDEFAALVKEIDSERYRLWLLEVRAVQTEVMDEQASEV